MNGRPLSLVLLLIASLALIARSASAQQPRNEIAVSAGRSQLHQFGDAPAVGLSYNRFWTAAVSTRFGAHVAAEGIGGGGEKTVGAYYASAEVHFLRHRIVSPYAGLGIAMAVSSLDADNDFSASESLLTAMASGGIDLNVTRRFALGADVRYLKQDAQLGDRFGINIDPLTVLVSAKLRY